MIQNLILEILLLKMLFPAYNFSIFIHMFQWTLSEFFFRFQIFWQKVSNDLMNRADWLNDFHMLIVIEEFLVGPPIYSVSLTFAGSPQKLSIKITYFAMQFCSKNLIHFMNLNSLEIENNMLPQHSQNPFWLYYKFFSKHISVWCQKKTFALHHFVTPKNCILEALWKQISVYFCRFLYI